MSPRGWVNTPAPIDADSPVVIIATAIIVRLSTQRSAGVRVMVTVSPPGHVTDVCRAGIYCGHPRTSMAVARWSSLSPSTMKLSHPAAVGGSGTRVEGKAFWASVSSSL